MYDRIQRLNAGQPLRRMLPPGALDGSHFPDTPMLFKALHQLPDSGNIIVVIEHNLDVVEPTDFMRNQGA